MLVLLEQEEMEIQTHHICLLVLQICPPTTPVCSHFSFLLFIYCAARIRVDTYSGLRLQSHLHARTGLVCPCTPSCFASYIALPKLRLMDAPRMLLLVASIPLHACTALVCPPLAFSYPSHYTGQSPMSFTTHRLPTTPTTNAI